MQMVVIVMQELLIVNVIVFGFPLCSDLFLVVMSIAFYGNGRIH